MKRSIFSSTTARLTSAAIAERALLGAVTFLATILLGRWAGPEELGLFAIFFPLLFVAIAFQESLIIVPYTVYASSHEGGDQRRRYLGSVLIHTGILGLILACLFLGATAWLAAKGANSFASLSLVLAAATPCVLLREFARRIVYADRKPAAAVVISGGVGALQLALMGALYASARLSAATAFGAIALSSLAGGLIWLALNWQSIQCRGAQVTQSFLQNWKLGGWNVATQVGEIVRTQMFPWLLAAAADEKTVGLYAACAVVAALPTPLQNALSNYLVPELVHVQKITGVAAVNRLTWQATAWLAGIMGAFCIFVAALSGRLVPWIYGDEFAGFAGTAHALIVVSVSQLFTGASLPAARALLVFKRPEQVCASHVAGVAANFALGVPMVVAWGIVGAAYAAFVGSALKAGLVMWWYHRQVSALQAEAPSNAGFPAAPRVASPVDPKLHSPASPCEGIPARMSSRPFAEAVAGDAL
jgi:O-antigen/teichoic acid export membrane protein